MSARALATAAAFSFLLCETAAAQLIAIKTVPVAEGDQFGFFPSSNLGMAGVSIALDDTLRDPFGNPARGMRLRGTHFFGSPSFYSVSNKAGSGQTLPLGGFVQRGSSYAGAVLALQEITDARRDQLVPPIVFGALTTTSSFAADLPPSPQTHTNRYAFAMLGRELAEHKLALGASVLWSGLTGVDGVELLYAGSRSIKQFGQAVDFRLGLQKDWVGNQSLAAVLVHNRFSMTHDVTFIDSFWDPATRSVQATPRLEHNPDRTNTWGLHLQYQRPLGDSGVRVGGIFTMNRMAHPKIPNYEIASVQVIPWDPGYSSAFNIGLGLSESEGPMTFAVDAIYEPIWSYTWGDAQAPITTALGATIPVGGKTVENHFTFSNAILRAGVGRDFKLEMPESSMRIQLGAELHSIDYHLSQFDNVVIAGRGHHEAWTEWTYTGGMSLRFPEVEVHYRARMTSGTGRPGILRERSNVFVEDAALAAGSSVIVAPNGPLTLTHVRVTTHQFSVSVPIR
jgi:hypothetical protein